MRRLRKDSDEHDRQLAMAARASRCVHLQVAAVVCWPCRLYIWVAAVLVLLLAGCASSRVHMDHPLVKEEWMGRQEGEHLARVYFIRPYTERYMGYADNRLAVEADRFPLMEIAKGEYTLLSMVPGEVWITVTNLTTWGPHSEVKEMQRSRRFEFQPGQTYYLIFQVVDGEYRGVFFLPELVDVYTARDLTRHLKPVGLARKSPLS